MQIENKVEQKTTAECLSNSNGEQISALSVIVPEAISIAKDEPKVVDETTTQKFANTEKKQCLISDLQQSVESGDQKDYVFKIDYNKSREVLATSEYETCSLCCKDKEVSANCVLEGCQHRCCKECMIKWIEKEEAAGQIESPTCPFCRLSMTENDVHDLLGRPFHPQTSSTSPDKAEVDELTLQWLNMHTRQCQRCGAYIRKAGGCHMVRCLCGNNFDYVGNDSSVGSLCSETDWSESYRSGCSGSGSDYEEEEEDYSDYTDEEDASGGTAFCPEEDDGLNNLVRICWSEEEYKMEESEDEELEEEEEAGDEDKDDDEEEEFENEDEEEHEEEASWNCASCSERSDSSARSCRSVCSPVGIGNSIEGRASKSSNRSVGNCGTEKIVLSTLTGNFNFTPKGNTTCDVVAKSDFPTAAIKYTSKTKLPSSKAIYYEVQVKSAGVSQLGWADIDNFAPHEGEGEGAGDQGKSWSFAGSEEAIKFYEGLDEGYGKVWGANDVIGCKYNPSKGTISFSMNGSDMGVAFDCLQKNMKLCPVMTVDGDEPEEISVFTHQNDMKYFQASDSCSLYDVIFGKAV